MIKRDDEIERALQGFQAACEATRERKSLAEQIQEFEAQNPEVIARVVDPLGLYPERVKNMSRAWGRQNHVLVLRGRDGASVLSVVAEGASRRVLVEGEETTDVERIGAALLKWSREIQ